MLLHLLMLSIVMVAGFTQANPANLQPFFSGKWQLRSSSMHTQHAAVLHMTGMHIQ